MNNIITLSIHQSAVLLNTPNEYSIKMEKGKVRLLQWALNMQQLDPRKTTVHWCDSPSAASLLYFPPQSLLLFFSSFYCKRQVSVPQGLGTAAILFCLERQ